MNLPRYEKRERLCLSLGTSDYLRTVGVTSVLAHCTVIHSDKYSAFVTRICHFDMGNGKAMAILLDQNCSKIFNLHF